MPSDQGARPSVPLGFGNITASAGDHIAHFYTGSRQRFDILGPYLATGIRRSEKSILISNADAGGQLREWLEAEGVDAARACRDGLLELHPGAATKEEMKTLADRIEADSLDAGHGIVRWAGDMAWALKEEISVSEMLRWEALYDRCSPGWQMCALCQYDLTLFRGDVVMTALRSHPLCIMGKVLVSNPLHVHPEHLLQQLSES